jgi:hypothetical protein
MTIKMNIKLIIQIAIGITGYVMWAVMAYFDPTLRPDFLKINVTMVLGTIGLVLRDMQGASLSPPAATADSASVPAPLAAPATTPPVQQP